MSPHHFLAPLMFVVSLGALAPAGAQTPAAAVRSTTTAATPAPATRDTGAATEQKIERIHIEDAGSRIDELRVGGETRNITVSPKGGMPSYEVEPATANRSPGAVNRNGSTASGGNRVWNVLGF